MYKDFNDYELIYLSREHNDKALKALLTKYQVYIQKTIYEYGLTYLKEDALQECLILLTECVKKYNMDSNCLFFTYFSVCVKHHIIKYLRLQTKNDQILEYNEQIDYDTLNESNNSFFFEEKPISFNTEIERNIYEKIFKDGMKAREFVKEYNVDIKQVYNYIYKIRKILKEIYK